MVFVWYTKALPVKRRFERNKWYGISAVFWIIAIYRIFFVSLLFPSIITTGMTMYDLVSSGNHLIFSQGKLLPDTPDLVHAPESSFKDRDYYTHQTLHLF